ncbi:MAG: hypothetical protein AAF731_06160 [Bacteroidota bacterium]
MKKKPKTFRNTHEYYQYLRNAEDKDLSLSEKRDRKQLYKTLDSIFSRANAPNKYALLTADGRKRLSTMMKPELKQRAQAYGEKEGYSIADVLEMALMDFLAKVEGRQ